MDTLSLPALGLREFDRIIVYSKDEHEFVEKAGKSVSLTSTTTSHSKNIFKRVGFTANLFVLPPAV